MESPSESDDTGRVDPVGGPLGAAALRERVGELEAQLAAERSRAAEARDRHEELVARLSREFVLEARARVEELKRMRRRERSLRESRDDAERELRGSRQRMDACERRLGEIRSSTTWRTGEVVLWLPKRLRSWGGRDER